MTQVPMKTFFLAGLNTLEEMIREEEKYLEDRDGLMENSKGPGKSN